MSRLSRWQVDALPDEDFAVLKPVRLSHVLDFEDAKHAWSARLSAATRRA
jgi:hypothetical protein